MKSTRFVFDVGIDDALLPPLIEYISACLLDIGVCDDAETMRVSIALDEALRNALYHGNLEITSAQRDGDAEEYEQLLIARRSQSPYRDRSLWVDVEVSPDQATFVIRDDGKGFDPSKLPDPTDPENLERISGRGVLLMKSFMDVVQYNQKGNEVTLIKKKSSPSSD
jgi:anti-sigma regulatory factor (Ser/Thr protein kinase)